VILATQEAEIGRIVIQSHPRQIVYEILSQKHPSQNKKFGRVVLGEGHEFKPQNHKKRKEKKKNVDLLQQFWSRPLSLVWSQISDFELKTVVFPEQSLKFKLHQYECVCVCVCVLNTSVFET
jgi:hypothetical protein